MSEDPNRKHQQDLEASIRCMQDGLPARVRRASNGRNVSRHFDNVPTTGCISCLQVTPLDSSQKGRGPSLLALFYL